MPPKRERSSDSNEGSSTTPSYQKKESKLPSELSPLLVPGRKAWTAEEEEAFLEIIDEVVKAGLWNAAKSRSELKGRKQATVQSHWDALFKKLNKS
ncbi:uncharacterized protein IL334_003375 [Kwoniella shivajii]|uniref:Myb-like domain-containing protein n=1 Tax=Kwoniella shivajii TaxID=564305 RepID=A0ABZ1CYM9_9TREE|nr:hypothetical protein IL334_003375 [Kwoniella shivajii]